MPNGDIDCFCPWCPVHTALRPPSQCVPVQPVMRPKTYIPDNTALSDHLEKMDERLLKLEAILDAQQQNIEKLCSVFTNIAKPI